jgi:peptide-methionine (S)-S-oxide reductase
MKQQSGFYLLRASAALATALSTALCISLASAQAPAVAKATFAGGCFWCVESDFDKIDGVISTTSGYSGGKTANPNYESVSSNTTGHYEVVEIAFDPKKVSYATLVEYFWRTVDPTDKNGQFCDKGSSYRTAIFAHDAEQLKVAKASLEALEKSKPFKAPIVTQIQTASAFTRAEEYHQDYYKKNPVRYKYYRTSCGRDGRLKELWGADAQKLPGK